jgi:CBS domain-containing protein
LRNKTIKCKSIKSLEDFKLYILKKNKMQINKIKIHDVITCKVDDKVNDIAKKLKKNNERRIFVVDKNEKLIGIITTTDIVYKSATEKNKDLSAKDIMTKEVKSVDIKEDLNKALEIMNKIKSYSCPLTENGKVIGLISYHDIIGHVFKSISE